MNDYGAKILDFTDTKLKLTIQEGHLGIKKCKARAKMCVYWPHINDSIEQLVKECSISNKYSRANPKQPLLSHSVPLQPWDKIGADYFTVAT